MPYQQLEKLLQKNYFLHQSARDGYRSYLQAYASYSLKKIFDVNQLDLAKVGKAFGFAVPPRVNVSVGGGTGGGGRTGKKRARDEDSDEPMEEHWEEIDAVDKVEEDENRREENEKPLWNSRRNSAQKNKRLEANGRRMVEKEVYKKGLERKKQKSEGGAQWSR